MATMDMVRSTRNSRQPRGISRWQRVQTSGSSVSLRAGIVAIMALWFPQSGMLSTVHERALADEPSVALAPSLMDGNAKRSTETIHHAIAASAARTPSGTERNDPRLSTLASTSVAAMRLTLPPLPTSPHSIATRMPLRASSYKEVGDMLAIRVQKRLQKSDMLVIWLLDTSQSLADKRDQLNVGLTSYFQHFPRRPETSHRMLNAIVTFGAKMKERVAPTQSHIRITNAIHKLPTDPTGTENTFESIERCAISYRKDRPNIELLIIVWTDESGDDAAKLEETIQTCQLNMASVTVIGPMAVLGSEKTTEPFVDPILRETHELPVTRGPDSALPERIELGYWFLTQEPDHIQNPGRGFAMSRLPSWFGSGNRVLDHHTCIAATQVDLPTWYGGGDLTGLVSGFGPYALTRLAAETGGTYVILTDNDHAGPFQNQALRAYLPDYRSIDAYVGDIESMPLRHAVMEAVKTLSGKHVGSPPTLLFGQQSETPPYGFMRTYYTPTRFANKVRMMRRRLRTEANRKSRIVEQALAHVSSSDTLEVGLDQEYTAEPSRRWKAWYDLTRGRLLATSVRLEAYRKTIEALAEPGFLEPATNYAVLVPSSHLRINSTYRYRADEAKRLLLRCVRQNPNTPWSLLAQRELDYALGLDVRQFKITLAAMTAGNCNKRLPLPKL